jgi:alcohol dehydrogenase class IV
MSTIFYITQVQFDFGAVRQLAAECERVGIKRPLVITDAGVRAAGVLQRALDALAAAGKVQSSGRARARRWMTPPIAGFTTTLLLPAPLPSD